MVEVVEDIYFANQFLLISNQFLFCKSIFNFRQFATDFYTSLKQNRIVKYKFRYTLWNILDIL